MKYIVKTRKDNTVLSLRKLNPIIEVFKTGKVTRYEIPYKYIEISKDVYTQLSSKGFELQFTKIIDGKIIEETKQENGKRLKIEEENFKKRKFKINENKVKDILKLLKPYANIELTKKGKQLLNGE